MLMRPGFPVDDGGGFLGRRTADGLEETLRLPRRNLHARAFCVIRWPRLAHEFLLQEAGHGADGMGCV